MKPLIAVLVCLFAVPLLIVLCLLAIPSQTARKALRVMIALIAAIVLVDELKELFSNKHVAKAIEAVSNGSTEVLTPARAALEAAMKAGGKVA
ncbi:MAG: hypothetical protein ACYC6M_02990 [Terriglobales bacterium]